MCIRTFFFFGSYQQNSIFYIFMMFVHCFIGEWAATSVGTNFTPHIITVHAGEVCFYVGKR